MGYVVYKSDMLESFCLEAFQKLGFTKDESNGVSIFADDYVEIDINIWAINYNN